MNYNKVIFRILKAKWKFISVDGKIRKVFMGPHPKLKIIPNKMFLVALMKKSEYKPDRYEIKKARNSGFNFKIFPYKDYIPDILEITSSPRQGGYLPDHWRNKEDILSRNTDGYGIFTNKGKLIAFGNITFYEGIWLISPFIGNKDYLNKGLMYLLFDELIEVADGYIMYDTFLGNSKGLTFFKKKLGFKEYNVLWL